MFPPITIIVAIRLWVAKNHLKILISRTSDCRRDFPQDDQTSNAIDRLISRAFKKFVHETDHPGVIRGIVVKGDIPLRLDPRFEVPEVAGDSVRKALAPEAWLMAS